jgi:lysozyme family protein
MSSSRDYLHDKGVFASGVEEKTDEAKGTEMSTFNRAMTFVLKWEGGYSNHPSDPGGETNFGIAKRAHPDVDIANLTEQGAKDIYRAEYWDKIRGDDLPDEIAVAVMDYAVNSGVDRASRALQGIVHAVKDGQIGDNTLAQVKVASDLLGSKRVAKKLVMQRSDFLCSLVGKKPDMVVFMKGWMRRTHSLMAEVCE